MCQGRQGVLLWGAALFFSHEIDAALAAEWRLLYGLRGLDEATASGVFTLAHVPIFAGLLWLLFHPVSAVQAWSRRAFMAFLVVHAGLHVRLSDSPLYGFSGWDSALLIHGAGLAGLCYLGGEWISRRARA